MERFTRMSLKKDSGGHVRAQPGGVRVVHHLADLPRLSRSAAQSSRAEVRIDGPNIAELSDLETGDLITFLRQLSGPAARVAGPLVERLQHLSDIGLGYLSLSRETATLSGGESQRLKLIQHLSNSLIEMLYVLMNPAWACTPAMSPASVSSCLELRDKGNTVLVVEHDPDFIRWPTISWISGRVRAHRTRCV